MPFSTSTGKANVIASIQKWLQANVISDPAFPWTYNFLWQSQHRNPQSVEVVEFQFFQPGGSAWGDLIFPTNTGGPQQGKLSQLMMKFEIIRAADEQDYLQRIRRVRDKIVHSIMSAGKVDDTTGLLILPPIEIFDYVSGLNTDLNVMTYVPTWDNNHMMEFNLGPTAEEPKFYIYRLLVKFEWYELYN